LTGALRDPAELCNPALADREAVEALLFDAFVPAAYRDENAGRWAAQNAEKWLIFIASFLERTIVSPNLAWWQLPLAVPRFKLMVGLVFGVAFGAAIGIDAGIMAAFVGGVRAGGVAGVISGVISGAGFGLLSKRGMTHRISKYLMPARRIRWRRPDFYSVGFAVLFGLVEGILTGNVFIGVLAVFLDSLSAWANSQQGTPIFINSAISPPAVLQLDRRAAVVVGVAAGLPFGGVMSIVAGVWVGVVYGVKIGAVAATGIFLVTGIGFGALVSFAEAAWISWVISRIGVALRKQLPWPLMDFLVDAHNRGVLRQAGVVYQFRHINLQHRLAARK
jgi:hypothetical protein